MAGAQEGAAPVVAAEDIAAVFASLEGDWAGEGERLETGAAGPVQARRRFTQTATSPYSAEIAVEGGRVDVRYFGGALHYVIRGPDGAAGPERVAPLAAFAPPDHAGDWRMETRYEDRFDDRTTALVREVHALVDGRYVSEAYARLESGADGAGEERLLWRMVYERAAP